MKKLVMCEESEGEYTVGEINTNYRSGTIAKYLSREKAEFLVTACNEYKKLKAKADAFDDAAGALRRHWAHCPNTASGCKLCDAHFKAKELQ